jgi:TM2 domain-containing membrane protein YozV
MKHIICIILWILVAMLFLFIGIYGLVAHWNNVIGDELNQTQMGIKYWWMTPAMLVDILLAVIAMKLGEK